MMMEPDDIFRLIGIVHVVAYTTLGTFFALTWAGWKTLRYFDLWRVVLAGYGRHMADKRKKIIG